MQQWCFIENTNRKYLITNTGKVFSARYCDYLKPDTKGYYYYVKIKLVNPNKTVNISIHKLLREYFPESLEHQEYYMDVESKKHDDEILKELKRKGLISK